MTQMSGSPLIIAGGALLALLTTWIATVSPQPLGFTEATFWPILAVTGIGLIRTGAHLTHRRRPPAALPPQPMTRRQFRQRVLKFEIFCAGALFFLLGGLTALLTQLAPATLTLSKAVAAICSTYAGFLVISQLAFRAYVRHILRHTEMADSRPQP